MISGRLEGVLALLPVAGAQLVGLQCVEYAQHFRRVAADRQVGHVDEADHALRIHDVGRALRHAGFRVENAERSAELTLDVREHRERQVAQLLLVLAPRQVHILIVGADTEQLRATVRKLAIELAEGRDLRRTYKSEVLWPEE